MLARDHQGLQHGQLGVKAHHWRNACQREGADGHHGSIERAALVQSGEVGYFFALEALARQQQDHTEGGQRRQHIGDDIEHGRAVGVRSKAHRIAIHHARHQTQQHEAHLRNSREGQHALDVGLRDSGEITDEQRANGEHHQHLLPVDRQRAQPLHQKTDADSKRSELGCPADHQRHRSGSTLVNVGDPHMKGHHTQLEGQTGNQEHQAKNQHIQPDLAAGNRVEQLGDVERAGGTVQHGHAIEQEAGSHGPQHEILHRSFGGSHVVPAQGYQCIGRQGQQLQPHVGEQEVVRRDHHEHAQ